MGNTAQFTSVLSSTLDCIHVSTTSQIKYSALAEIHAAIARVATDMFPHSSQSQAKALMKHSRPLILLFHSYLQWVDFVRLGSLH